MRKFEVETASKKRSQTWLSMKQLTHYRPVNIVFKDIAIGAGGFGFYSRAGQIRHGVAIGSPPLRHKCGVE